MATRRGCRTWSTRRRSADARRDPAAGRARDRSGRAPAGRAPAGRARADGVARARPVRAALQRPRLRRLLRRRAEPPRRDPGAQRLLDPPRLLHLRPGAARRVLAAPAARDEQQGRLQQHREHDLLHEGRLAQVDARRARGQLRARPHAGDRVRRPAPGLPVARAEPDRLLQVGRVARPGPRRAGQPGRAAAHAVHGPVRQRLRQRLGDRREQVAARPAPAPLRERARARGLRRLAGPARRPLLVDARGPARLAAALVARLSRVRPPAAAPGGRGRERTSGSTSCRRSRRRASTRS